MRATGVGDGREHEDRGRCETSYGEYNSARERFFEGLRVDSEIRRLESAWRMPSRKPSLDDRATG